MKNKMLLSLREALGIGMNEYTTNDNEAMNAVIKQKVDYKANDLGKFLIK